MGAGVPGTTNASPRVFHEEEQSLLSICATLISQPSADPSALSNRASSQRGLRMETRISRLLLPAPQWFPFPEHERQRKK